MPVINYHTITAFALLRWQWPIWQLQFGKKLQPLKVSYVFRNELLIPAHALLLQQQYLPGRFYTYLLSIGLLFLRLLPIPLYLPLFLLTGNTTTGQMLLSALSLPHQNGSLKATQI